MDGYGLSFLITDAHVQQYTREKLVNFIINFVETLSQEMHELKLDVERRTKAIADQWWLEANAWLQTKLLKQ